MEAGYYTSHDMIRKVAYVKDRLIRSAFFTTARTRRLFVSWPEYKRDLQSAATTLAALQGENIANSVPGPRSGRLIRATRTLRIANPSSARKHKRQ